MAIKIDYSVLDDTARYMRELAGSFGQLKNYGQELNSSLNPSLREWALDAQEPYGLTCRRCKNKNNGKKSGT